ncbi:dTMP kinase [Rhodobium orientis]|uniref:Thymidylate kinase n=1 Tax=Rhodobium orientis TaxID=34017 RepID=A0A327JQ78_9HYPH|nr:dTMP kinase [Rhodobium orientis]MBB4302483.1 dTMP kinase [Rhodobium orientis]MBK5949332.1 dTMP kinase [Rhodobium orientis]RAI28619.1 dTMP kinase [Rhodobium orientis]
MAGTFITFEGGEGAGKSTQIRRLAARLETLGLEVVTTREPGGSPGAEAIREVLLSGKAKALGPLVEATLFAAARIDHVANTIRPALERGAVVLCDRFTDSTRVYQGDGDGVDAKTVAELERIAVDDVRPGLTLILDLPVEVALERIAARRGDENPDRFEGEADAVHRRRREAFLTIAENEPERCAVIDASGDEDTVAGRIWAAVAGRLELPAGTSPAEARHG